jgi:hypothetical protein
MNLISKSLSVIAAIAAFAVPAVASAQERGGHWSHGGHERGHEGWGHERGHWVAPRYYDRAPVYTPRVYVAPRVYAPHRVYVAPRVHTQRVWRR